MAVEVFTSGREEYRLYVWGDYYTHSSTMIQAPRTLRLEGSEKLSLTKDTGGTSGFSLGCSSFDTVKLTPEERQKINQLADAAFRNPHACAEIEALQLAWRAALGS